MKATKTRKKGTSDPLPRPERNTVRVYPLDDPWLTSPGYVQRCGPGLYHEEHFLHTLTLERHLPDDIVESDLAIELLGRPTYAEVNQRAEVKRVKP